MAGHGTSLLKRVVQVVNLLQSAAPLWEALCSYKDKGVLPFHTPGHKLRGDLFPRLIEELGPGVFQLDPSDEVEDITINHDFHCALEAYQQLAAELFGGLYSVPGKRHNFWPSLSSAFHGGRRRYSPLFPSSCIYRGHAERE